MRGDGLGPSFERLRERVGETPPGLDVRRQADALERRVRQMRERRAPANRFLPRLRSFLLGGALVAAAAAGVLLVAGRDGTPTWRGAAGELAVGTPIVAEHPLELRSTDGIVATLAAGSAAAITRASASEAMLRLDRGGVETSVEPGRRRTVRVVAGPFTVTVVGTAFTVDWDPTSSRVRVAVAHGRVRVDGPSLPATSLFLGPGERFERGPAEPPSEPQVAATLEAPSAQAEPEPPSEEPAPTRPRRVSPAAPAGDGWQALMRERRYAEAFAAARAVGLGKLERQLPVRQLADLADVARFAGEHTSSAKLLRALRSRHPRKPEAATAAFVLGRLSADHLDRPRDAARWFGVYLREQPAGPLAEEALGRRLAVLGDVDPRAARPLAHEYLRRHPQGAWAAFARRVIESP